MGTEGGSRVSKAHLDLRYERVRAAKDAPRNPCRVLERRHGFADITERGAGVHVERPRVIDPHRERQIMSFPETASRCG